VIVADLQSCRHRNRGRGPRGCEAVRAGSRQHDVRDPFYDPTRSGCYVDRAEARRQDDRRYEEGEVVLVAGYPECRTRITRLLGLKQIYGLTTKFVPLGSISV
jgi:hypothetical protein